VVEKMADMPAGVIGLRASGKLTRDDYREVLEPALQEAVDTGAARVVFVIESYEGLEGRALLEDLKTGVRVELRDRKLWKRLGVVTNQEWIAKAMHLFAWAMPGDLRVFDLDELDEAKGWAAAD
jgi:SpoIIAA-like